MENTEVMALPERLAGAPEETTLAPDAAMEQFQQERRSCLGGTDMAAIVGMNPWRTAWDVAAEKKGLIPPLEGTERMEWGLLLEEPIAREYAKRTGQRIRRVNALVRDKQMPFLGGHPDRLVIGQRKGLEVKTVAGKGAQEWSLPGEPVKIPKHYYIQCQHYASITGYEAWDLAALFNMTAMRIYPVEPNEKVIRALRAKGQAFWQQYVEGEELPPMEPSAAAEAYLKTRFPANTLETFVEANPEQEEAIRRWIEAKEQREVVEKEEKAWKVKVQAAIGSNVGIRSYEYEVTWKKDRDSVELVTDYEAALLELAGMHGIEVPAGLLTKHTKSVVTRQGARKMRDRAITQR